MKLIKVLIPIMVLTLAGCNSNEPKHEHGNVLTVYSFNDVHGTFDNSDGGLGLLRANTYIKSQEDYIPEMTMLLSAGDMYQGSGISNLTDGKAMVDVMNAMNFDAMTVGNHEFDWGIDILKANIEASNFPVVSYDIYEKATDAPVSWVDPYTIVEKGGYKIGVIGEIGNLEGSIASSMIADHKFVPNVDEVNTIAKDLKNNKDCDLVFLLTHNGSSNIYRDLDSSYISAIFGGHTHTVEQMLIGDIPYIQAGEKTEAIGKLTYDFKTKKLDYSSYSFSADDLTEYAEDESLVTALAPYVEETNPILNEVIGEFNGRFTASKLGKLVTKSMYDYAVSKGVSETNLIAVHNQRGVRVDSIGTADEITSVAFKDIYEAFPFDNDVRLVRVKGSRLKGLSSVYYYGDITALALLDNDTTYDVISISYLTESSTGALYNEGGGECLSDKVVYCRDLVKDMLKAAGTLNASDF